MSYEDSTLELARMERQMLAAIRAKIAAQQLGEAWAGLSSGPAVHAVNEVPFNGMAALTPTS